MHLSTPDSVTTATVLVLDDHPIVRRGLSDLINQQSDLEVCAVAENAQEAIRLIEELQPHLAVVDLSLNDGGGLEVVKHVKSNQLPTRIICYSRHDELVYAERALAAGALGYVNKREPVETVLAALRKARDGNIFLSEAMAGRSLSRMIGVARPTQGVTESLSDRELEVFELLGQGLTTRQIATKMKLSHKTVESFREKIKAKLQLENSNQLIRQAVKWVVERE